MNTTEKFARQICIDKLTSLYSSYWYSALGTLSVACVYVAVQFPNHNPIHLFSWFGFLVFVFVWRYFVYKRYYKESPNFKALRPWLLRMRLSILISGLTMASTIIFFYPDDNILRQTFTIFILTSMAAGGLAVHVADLVSYKGYLFSLMFPVIIVSALTGGIHFSAIAILASIYIVIMLWASKRLNDIFTSSRRISYKNLSRVESLELEKKQLSNRLGRIFKDSSTELYIANATTHRYLQVNSGALQNLGYTAAEMSAMALHHVIVDIDTETINRITKPLWAGTDESITFKTHQQRKDGSTYPAKLRFQLSVVDLPPILVITAIDITDRVKAERKLLYQANYDPLTNLPNRYYMLSFIGSAFARTKRSKAKAALLFMDLDNFKDINDTLGHGVGDKMLKQVALRIQSYLRRVDTAARLGGDEFLVLLEGLKEQDHAAVVVHKILEAFDDPFLVGTHEIYTSVSIGISIFPDDGDTVELLMQHADTAMYHAKNDGNRRYRFFSHELRALMDQQIAIESRLRHAIKKNELTVYYQPKIDIRTEQIIGAEALLRWHNPDLGQVPPGVFIPVAEKYGLIEDIGSWVLRISCEEASSWKEICFRPLHIAVNISPRQFRSNNFLNIIDNVLHKSGLPKHLLEIEITENLLMQNTGVPLEILNALQKLGITLSLDDFGTGYSSLSYLKEFPLQVLKIDRIFINDMMENKYNMSLVDAIIAMAQMLDLTLVAEGVETKEQLAFLRKRNVDIVQGFLFSRPVPAQEFRELVHKGSF
ncbi:MAG: EAL domain-containing protein [Desulfobacteraceae bacterium]|jgi:diguanylate cyclase (GGDEF)-like protein/PAS domain S-box-containing protein